MNHNIQKLSGMVDELANSPSRQVNRFKADNLNIDLKDFFEQNPDSQTLSKKYASIFRPIQMLSAFSSEIPPLYKKANWKKVKQILSEYTTVAP